MSDKLGENHENTTSQQVSLQGGSMDALVMSRRDQRPERDIMI